MKAPEKNRRNGEKTRLIANHAYPDVRAVINLATILSTPYVESYGGRRTMINFRDLPCHL